MDKFYACCMFAAQRIFSVLNTKSLFYAKIICYYLGPISSDAKAFRSWYTYILAGRFLNINFGWIWTEAPPEITLFPSNVFFLFKRKIRWNLTLNRWHASWAKPVAKTRLRVLNTKCAATRQYLQYLDWSVVCKKHAPWALPSRPWPIKNLKTQSVEKSIRQSYHACRLQAFCDWKLPFA